MYILESHGSGAAFFDHDSDGDLDLYITNGATFTTYRNRSGPGNALYRNKGDGTFADITGDAGVGDAGWSGGVAVGDIDNDGHQELYATNYGANVLYRNKGDGTFADITSEAGIGGDQYSASAAFFDYDHDGDLDLYVANYVVFDAEHLPAKPALCSFYGGLQVYCGPKGLLGAPDALYRNEGDGRFSDVTQIAGIAAANRYYGLGVVPVDYDDDGDTDLFVANDETPNVLWQNQDDGTFTDIALIAGVAYNGDGDTEAGMGVDFGDYDNDGDPDIYVTHFFTETNTLYRNENGRRFSDVTTTAGLAAATVDLLGWGTRFFDYDNDGRLDLFVANGHVYPQVEQAATGSTYGQSNQLFRNLDHRRFDLVDIGLTDHKVSRGTASGDYDNDGDIDLFVVELNDAPTLLRNDGGNTANWLVVQVIGSDDNRDGAGTRIRLQIAGQSQSRTVNGAASYLSHNDLRVHFGLGESEKVAQVEIIWPNGSVDIVEQVPANKLLVVRQNTTNAILELGSNPF
ncbi:MAG TPA: CRTAC1 family protein [Candidatus Latescibacteria bacterium]|nr:CRTAC1 family protein [Candidatus Handelsmanbacteria bacterium]HIL09682.1 CRTAC1 family protein [Candidatus Latescibacterota bacterium]